MTQKTLPNGNYETYTYDVRGRVEDIVLKNSVHTVLRKLEHTYDAVDNITEIVETRGSAVTKTFGYDDIDQLISEDWSTGYTADYEYDANGNRTKRTVGATVEDYFYDDGDKLTEIKIGGIVTKSYGYDDSGRRTSMTDSGGTTDYAYDSESRLTSITRSGLTTNSFGYNGFDTRVSKTDSMGTTSYKRAGAGVTSSLLKSTISSTTTDYTPGISSRVSSTSTFMHSGLKNSDEQSGSGGTIAASLQYDAFGKQVSSSGTWVGAFKYGGAYGYQTDPDHGLKLLGHRYYEADTGRFLTRDPIKDGRNWYGYCENGPLNRADPSGLWFHMPPYDGDVHNHSSHDIWVIGDFANGGTAALLIKPGFKDPPGFDADELYHQGHWYHLEHGGFWDSLFTGGHFEVLDDRLLIHRGNVRAEDAPPGGMPPFFSYTGGVPISAPYPGHGSVAAFALEGLLWLPRKIIDWSSGGGSGPPHSQPPEWQPGTEVGHHYNGSWSNPVYH